MRNIFKRLFIFLIILLPFSVKAETSNKIIIDDKANLLTDLEKVKLEDKMSELLKYGNVVFYTDNQKDNTSTGDKARYYYRSNLEYKNGFIFFIDMYKKEIYIHTEGDNSSIITDMKANIITNNVYSYVKNKEYYNCAYNVFDQIYTLLEGGKIAEPLKHICSIILALITSFLLCFLYAYFTSQSIKPNKKEIASSVDAKMEVTNFKAEITGKDKVFNPMKNTFGILRFFSGVGKDNDNSSSGGQSFK